MKPSLIRRQPLLSLRGHVLLSAEGRRQFTWSDATPAGCLTGRRTPTHENRWVAYTLMGKWTLLIRHHRRVSLPLTPPVDGLTVYAAQCHYEGLDAQFHQPLCRLGHDWLNVDRAPCIHEGLGLEDMEEAGWTV